MNPTILLNRNWISKSFEHFWGKEENPVVQRGGASCLPIHLTPKPVFVRKEYLSLWDYIKKVIDQPPSIFKIGGVVLIGQPGSGKSKFLNVALFMALSKGVPVAYCNDPSDCYLCDENGCRVVPLGMETTNVFPPNVLVLVDSPEGVPPVFAKDDFQGFVVQATSPDRDRWYVWAKERKARFWTMPLWTKPEILCLQELLEDLAGSACPWKNKYYSPLELFDIIGPSARTCLLIRHKSGRGLSFDFHDFDAVELNLDHRMFIDFLKTRQVPATHQGSTFHQFFFGSNYHQMNPTLKPRFSYEVPTSFLRSLVVQEFRRLKVAAQMKLAEELAPYPQIAWMFYEALVIDVLVSSEEGFEYHLCGDGEAQTFRLGPNLRTIPELVCDSQNICFTPENDRIYVPPTGFPSNDAFAITENKKRVVFLQATTAQDHDLKTKGIYDTVKLFPKVEWESIEWFFVFVSPTDRARDIAVSRMHDLKWFKVDGVNVKVRVGWMCIKNIDQSTFKLLENFYSRKPHGQSQELVDEENLQEDRRGSDKGDGSEAKRLDPPMNIGASVKRSRQSPPPEEKPPQRRRVDVVEDGPSRSMETGQKLGKLHARMKPKQKKK